MSEANGKQTGPRQPLPLSAAPLAQPRVQWTVVGLACMAFSVLVATADFSAPQHNAVPSAEDRVLLRIDLNRADSRELTLLPGVGPVLARRILENRRRQGHFSSIDDLDRVHGIGKKTIEGLRAICVVENRGPTSKTASTRSGAATD